MKNQDIFKNQTRPKAKHRVLIVDDDSVFARRVSDGLFDHGFEARITGTIGEAKELVEYWRPDTVFVDLMLPDANALALLKHISAKALAKIPRVIVMSRQSLSSGAEQMRRAGASAFLVKPFPMEDILAALNVKERAHELEAAAGAALDTEVTNPGVRGLGPSALKELHLLGLFLKQAARVDNKGLHKLMRMINMKVGAVRTSIIQCEGEEVGHVLASNDRPDTFGLKVALRNYPEIAEARRTGKPVLIPNIHTSDVLASVHIRVTETPYVALAVFPVFRKGRFAGAMSVRMSQKDPAEMIYTEKFGDVCAQIISLTLSA